MALPSSGAISLNEMHIEIGGSSGSEVSINDSDIRGLISKSASTNMSFSEWYGASNTPVGVNFIGRDATNLASFPNGTQTFSSGNKIIVIAVISQQTSASTPISTVTVGGASLTKAVDLKSIDSGNRGGNVAIFYKETTASGALAINGAGFGTGAGPSEYQAFELTNFISSTPAITVSTHNVSSPATSHGITFNGQDSNGAIIVAGRSYLGTNTVKQSATIRTDAQSSGSSTFTVSKTGIPSGNVTYTVTNDNPVGSVGSTTNGLFVMVGAQWR